MNMFEIFENIKKYNKNELEHLYLYSLLRIADMKDRIDKSIKYLKLSNPAHWSNVNEIELLKILKGE